MQVILAILVMMRYSSDFLYLRFQISFLFTEKNEVCYIYSPQGGSGKTTLAIGIAMISAQSGRKTLLVDGAIYGSLQAAFHMPGTEGRGIEAVLVLLFVMIVFMAVIGIGLYIYDMSVYVFAANKAMDMGITKLSEDHITLVDEISGNELDSQARQEITKVALDAMSLTVATEQPTEADVHITTTEQADKVTLTIRLTGRYTLGIPTVGNILPDFDYDLEYLYSY